MTVGLRHPVDEHGLGLTSQRVRERLIQRLLANGIQDARVLDAIRGVPRHLFVDEAISSRAYEDTALPIGNGQTISQPWIVARMTEVLLAGPGHRRERRARDQPSDPASDERDQSATIAGPEKVLEIGTGSGYQAAVLAALVPQVFTIERIGPLLRQARRRFRHLGLDNIRSRHDDGRAGWPEEAPFDAIVVTAAAARIEPAWREQLAEGGLIIAPVGDPGATQRLVSLRRVDGEWQEQDHGAVVFVPILPGVSA